MHVAKYWRNRKLRYQLIRYAKRPGREPMAIPGKTPDEIARELRTLAKRSKAVA